MLQSLAEHWFFRKLSDPWVLFGFLGQFIFMMRFVVQWIASERRGRSVVPIAFWYLSLGGGVMILVYAYRNQDPVIMFGQALGLFIYLRNLALISGRRARVEARRALLDERATPAAKPPVPDQV